MARSKRIVVNVEADEIRVAILESNVLSEIYVERREDDRYVGNIYKGRVDSVVPGIQSAFVDIGLEKNGFLYVTDVLMAQDEDQVVDFDADFDIEAYKRDSSRVRLPIEKMLSPGDEVIVQVEKEPISNKGVRLTNFVSIPGRYAVLMPTVKHKGISRQIGAYEERTKLREIVGGIKFLKDYGCIVRTAARGRQKKELVNDFKYLNRIWSKVLKGKKKTSAPALLHEEANLIARLVRDHFDDHVDEFVIDSKEEFKQIRSFVSSIMPEAKDKVTLYKREEPIFYYYGIEREIAKVTTKNVSLPCGGYLVIEQTEALVAIDINTGRNVGRGDFEKTVFKTNMEAVAEIPRQLKLRDIGGIVIIDFIDMKSRKNQMEVYNALNRELRKDKSKTNVLHVSRMGLIEMTRQRRGEGLFKNLYDACPYCEGTGHVKSAVSSTLDIIRQLRLLFLRVDERDIIVEVSEQIADLLLDRYRDYVKRLERKYRKRIDVRRDRSMHIEEVRFLSGATKKELEVR